MTAPDTTPSYDADPRTEPPLAGDETTTLRAFLDYHRDTLRMKVGGLDAAQLARTLPPSDLTLAGLLKHVTWVEDHWFSHVLLDEGYAGPWGEIDFRTHPDWELRSAVDDSPSYLRELFDEVVARSDAVTDRLLATPEGLDTLSRRVDGRGERFNLRWVLVHLVEEYARHNGHADLIRQAVDGSVGE